MRANEIIDDVRQIGQISSDDVDYTPTAILRECTQALIEKFAKPLHALRMGYWVHRITQSLTTNQAFYRMPQRGTVHGLVKLEFATSITAPSNWNELPIVTESQAGDYQSQVSGQPAVFQLESDGVVLLPPPNTAGWYLKFSYILRPATLVADVTGGNISSVAASSVVVNSVPAGITGGSTVDLQHTNGSFECSAVNLTVASVVGTTINFSGSPDLTRVIAGDVVRTAETTDYPMLPLELHRALCDYVASVIWASKGDYDRAQVFAGKTDSSIANFIDMAVPRVKNRPFVFKTRNTYLRQRIGSQGSGWR